MKMLQKKVLTEEIQSDKVRELRLKRPTTYRTLKIKDQTVQTTLKSL